MSHKIGYRVIDYIKGRDDIVYIWNEICIYICWSYVLVRNINNWIKII